MRAIPLRQLTTRTGLRIISAMLLLVVFCMFPSGVQAASYTVTNTNDSGAGSLRQIVGSAIPGSTITFAPALTGQTITLTSAGITISRNLNIIGLGAQNLTVSGNNKYRVFNISGPVTVKISGMTITNGYVKYMKGGGINNLGTLTLDNVIVQNSKIDGGTQGLLAMGGAGIYSSGTLNVLNSTIQNNSDISFSTGGGGIYNDGKLTVQNSTITGNVVHSNTVLGQYGGGGITNRKTATLINATVTNNTADSFSYGGGGGIINYGTLNISGSLIANNVANNTFGGGLMNWTDATLNIDHSAITGNTTSMDGGGIESYGNLTIKSSTISGNSAAGTDFGGGGIDVPDGVVSIENSTISNNSAVYHGGGVLNYDGTITINFTTISGNSAAGGGGVYSEELASTSVTNLNNSIVANSVGGDCLITSGTVNNANTLIMDNTCSPTFSGDPLLGPLQNNGGNTDTQALLPGSPALDQAVCGTVTLDQRGAARPADLPDVPNFEGGGGCDLGAFELQP